MADWLIDVILGLVEGFTEFLPISSTGHLIITRALLDLEDEVGFRQMIVIQGAAILAVCFQYRARLWETATTLTSSAASRRFVLGLFLAFLPAAVAGLAFEDTIRHANHGFGEAAMTGLSTAFARLLGLAKVHQVAVGARSRNAENRLLKVLALMREDVARPWTLEELARKANLSPPHFTALCRRQTGMPPLSLLIRLRLQRAMDLLQRGDHNVAEAARAVGYEDPFYFSRLFKKHIGMTPSSCMHGP